MKSKKEIEHLESISHFYKGGDIMDEMMIEREIEIINRYFEKDKSVLEVGCGSGFSTERLYKIFKNYDVIEPSKKNISLLKEKVPEINCYNFLLEDFVTDKKYDYIFFLNIIEHVEDPIKSLEQLIPLLKDGGLIFISCPNCMSLNRRVGLKIGLLESYDKLAPKDILVGHRRLYTVDMLKDHCENAGLKVLTMKGIYLKPMSEKQMFDLGLEALRAYHSIGEDLPEYCATLFAIVTKKYY